MLKAYQKVRLARLKIMSFGILLLTLLFSFIATAILSNDNPIILGTEMNTNGLVEYMCLGRGCEDFTQFKWRD